MDNFIEFITQIEVLGSAGVVALLSGVAFIRKQFKNGLFVKSIVAYAGAKLIELFKSDKPEDQAKANAVLETVLALPSVQDLFKRASVGADASIAMLEAELANIKVKLEASEWSQETTTQLIKAQQAIQEKLNEISS